MTNKFDVNECVLCNIGNEYKLGIVKQVIERECPDFPVDSEQHTMYIYRVWFETSEITELVNEVHLHSISNDSAFTILRKQKIADASIPCTCSQMARKILADTEIHGPIYLEFNDWLTSKLSMEDAEVPFIGYVDYLNRVLTEAIEGYMVLYDLDYTSQDVDKIIESLYADEKRSVLNSEYIKEKVLEYTYNNKGCTMPV